MRLINKWKTGIVFLAFSMVVLSLPGCSAFVQGFKEGFEEGVNGRRLNLILAAENPPLLLRLRPVRPPHVWLHTYVRRFEITIGDSIKWVKLDNQFSDHDGADVAELPITVKNLSDETHGLKYVFLLFLRPGWDETGYCFLVF